MNKRKLQCPICKAKHELMILKHTYDCPSCGRKVRAMDPIVAKHNAADEKKKVIEKVEEVVEVKKPKKAKKKAKKKEEK